MSVVPGSAFILKRFFASLTMNLLVAIALVATAALGLAPIHAHAAKTEKDMPTIRFGAALSLTGKLANEGRLVKEGYELWKEQVNGRGGIPVGDRHYRVEILYRDDRSEPGNTAPLVEKLLTENQVDFLLGPYGSGATFEAAAVAERHRVPMVEGGGASDKIFSSGFRYTFGLLGPGSDYFREVLEGAAALQPKPVRVAVVAADQSIHREIAEGARQHVARLGFQLAGFHLLGKETDLSALTRGLKDEAPEMILFSSYFEDAVPFIRAAKATGLGPAMIALAIAPSQPEFVEQLGRDADYVYGTAQWLPSLPYHGPVFGTPADYAELFRTRFASEPDYHAAAASAAGLAYHLAFAKTGSLDRERVRDALAALDAMTFYGRIHFDDRGRDVSNPFTAFQIQKGRTVALWPQRLAGGAARYPAPAWREREPELKVAVLHYGPVDDYGWTWAGYRGAEAMADALPYVTLLQKEGAYGGDSAATLRELAQSGYQVIFAHSYDFGAAIAQVAPDYPQIKFMWAAGQGHKTPNTGFYFERAYQVRYLNGMVAGAMTKTNRIGFVAAMPISEVIRSINAFARGVAAVNADARVYVRWLGAWYNPPKERDAAFTLIDQGCDVITQHSDSYEPAVAANSRGVCYISAGSDLRRFAPYTFLTGMDWNWGPIMTDVVRAVREGTWQRQPGQDWWYGLDRGGATLIPCSDLVPERLRIGVEEKQRDMAAGRFSVFPGLSDEDLRAMTALEPNVIGESPRLVEYDYPETRELVGFVQDAAEAIRNEGEEAFPAFRRAGGKWFQGDHYVFVWDLQGNRYVYPPDPANEHDNMADLRDVGGKPIGRMIIEAVSGPSGEGWVHYQWNRPGDPTPVWKSTYLMRVDAPSGKTYLVGSGAYNMRVERVFVERVVDQAAALLRQKGRAAFATLRDKRSPFFFHDTYVFVTSADGVELVNPAFPDLEGRSIIDIRDARGKYLVRDYIAAAFKHGAAWVSYYWPRPGSQEPVGKLSYVKKVRVENEDLVVGAGIYEQP
jgi:branched-chain amino acid transport system substrate-binding protein